MPSCSFTALLFTGCCGCLWFIRVKKSNQIYLWKKKVGGCEKIHWLRKMRECQWGRDGVLGPARSGGGGREGAVCWVRAVCGEGVWPGEEQGCRSRTALPRGARSCCCGLGFRRGVRGTRESLGWGLGGECAAGSEDSL